jgi:Xaa-Pro aminopeptidase
MVLDERLQSLRLSIKSADLGAALISKVSNIIYLTGYSGFSTEEREAFLLIDSKRAYVFTDGRYSEAVKKLILGFELVEVSSSNRFADLLRAKIDNLRIKTLGVEENDLRVSEYKTIKKAGIPLKDFKFHHNRSIKTKEEIDLIDKACRIGDKAFEYIKPKITSGITERELAFLLENYIREQGCEPSFKTIVAFGPNSAIPHHQTSDAKLKKGDFVLLDFGVKFKSYCSDMTRTLVFGSPSPEQKKIYETVLQAQTTAFEYIQQNINQASGKKADGVARESILKAGYPSIPHSLGHGIGIEVHEHPFLSPNSKEGLKPGMVFSIEPGIYLPGSGGVRIEDLFVIDENGIRQITKSPKNLSIV